MILTAFLGYVLPWGQMSFWAATVITNLASIIPFIGYLTLILIWGNFSINAETLTRFFSLHYFLPFCILGLVSLHLYILHQVTSNNLLGLKTNDNVSFFPYYIIKDILGILIYLITFFFFLFFFPNILAHSDNYIPANPLITPAHIVPEWYFLMFYAMLRAIPNKSFGVIILISSIIIYIILPYIFRTQIRNITFKPLSRFNFIIFISICFCLTYLGAQPLESYYIFKCQLLTIIYFSYLLIFIIFIEFIETEFYIYNIINFFNYIKFNFFVINK